MRTKTVQRKIPSVHEQLKLQSTYKMRVTVDGHIDKTHYRLRGLASQTGGTMIVYAKSVNWGNWQEINRAEFEQLGAKIINPRIAEMAKDSVVVTTAIPVPLVPA